MAKVQLAVALSLLSCLAAPVGAQAQTFAPVAKSAPIVFTESEDHGDSEDSGDHGDDGKGEDNQNDGAFGGSGDEGDSANFVPLPPVVVSPREETIGHADPVQNFHGVAPAKDHKSLPPVRVDQVRPTQKTPADAFAEASYIALGALGLGAISLGAVAGVRSYRLRKAGKADYFYES